MKKSAIRVIIEYGTYFAAAFAISRGGFFAVTTALSVLYAVAIRKNILLAGALCLALAFTDIINLSLLGVFTVTLAVTLSAFAVRLLPIRARAILESLLSLSAVLPYTLFCGFILKDFILAALISGIAYYLFGKLLVIDNDSELSSIEYTAVIVAAFLTALGLIGIPCFNGTLFDLFAPLFTLCFFAFLLDGFAYFGAIALGFAGYFSFNDVGYVVSYSILAVIANFSVRKYIKFAPFLAILAYAVEGYVINAFNSFDLTGFILYSIGCLGVLLIPKNAFKTEKTQKERKVTESERMLNEGRNESGKRIKELAEAFNCLAKELSGDNFCIENENLLKIIICECKKGCAECAEYANCAIKSSDDEFEALAISGMAKGNVNLLDLSENMYKRCVNKERLLSLINSAVNKSNKTKVKKACKEDLKETLKKVFSGLYNTLNAEAVELNREVTFDRDLEFAVYEELKLINIRTREIFCSRNSRGLPFVKIVFADKRERGKSVAKAVSRACGMGMVAKNKRGDGNYVCYSPKVSYDVVFGVATKTKSGSEVSGDSFILSRIFDYSFMVALSDGMGSGANAKKMSEKTLNSVESLYKVGFSDEVVCPLVNTLLTFSATDGYAATDIAVIDLVNSSLDVLKLGAPPSFLINDSVTEISGEALPVGALEDITPTKKRVALKTGDVLVLMSDGIYDALKNKTAKTLVVGKDKNPQGLCDYLLNEALEVNNGNAYDDMTVIAIKIV